MQLGRHLLKNFKSALHFFSLFAPVGQAELRTQILNAVATLSCLDILTARGDAIDTI
ncbi:uncharacterized protein [Physcomitrium patens]|uniref:uncharacterized protein isoform X2 n=1 Tax=Physcomitrium patens TaxID=3218 RepID=UPI003CCCD4F7